MKTIGLIGGMSWESTLFYYRHINEAVRKRLGGLHSAKLLLYSVDFDPIERLQHAGNWDATAKIISGAARSLQAGGADFFLICTNTMHRVAETVAQSVDIPLLHIADGTAAVLKSEQISRIGLLGTSFTMEQAFYKDRLTRQHGIEVVVPDSEDREVVHHIIYQELCLGEVKPASRDRYLHIVDKLVRQGAEGVILGCTEIGMLIEQSDTPVRLFDTTAIHANEAVKFAFDA
ncbi:MAG: aspartate/glutamate racemase family protein [Gammaproteobacteria bacterium]|nr:MAG: aspartate/glutamate racemase family protein [Gammaproteobacteria bacterium]